MFTEQTERRCMAFVRTVANDCATCLRRDTKNCGNCRSIWAKSILREMENDRDGNSRYVDYSIAARTAYIMCQLKSSCRPLLSCEITVNGICSRQLKRWTIKRMIERGMIVRTLDVDFNTGRRYLYSLNKQYKYNQE